jgi:hypothetical protein
MKTVSSFLAGTFVGAILLSAVWVMWGLTYHAIAPHSPCPPFPNCQCGCVNTGACVCKNCDHPQLTK